MPSDIHHTDSRVSPSKPQQAPVGHEGRAVVTKDGKRQSVLFKELLEDSLDLFKTGGCDKVNGENEAAVGISDGERLALLAIFGTPPAFEVDGPDVVGRFGTRVGLGIRVPLCANLPRCDDASTLQYARNRACGRHFPSGVPPKQDDTQLLWAPGRLCLSDVEDFDSDVRCAGDGGGSRSRATVEFFQSQKASFLEAMDPLVASLPADVELSTQSSEIDVGLQCPEYEFFSLIHCTRPLPRHQ